MPEGEQLRRRLGLPLITSYGLGTIVGGGFYALVGKVAAEAGIFTPLSFLSAAVIALFSAFSFAELSSRFPYCAGEARYVQEAFGKKWLAVAVGWMVIATGVVSAATLARAFAGFLQSLIALPEHYVIFAMVVGLGLVAAVGIGESVWLATVITVVEIGGLLFVVFSAGDALMSMSRPWEKLLLDLSFDNASGIMLGAYLAFYSFVGFEDMVNVAEEVKRPRRNLPIAILLSLGLAAALYFSVTLVAVAAVPLPQLISSDSPLSSTVGAGTASAAAITVIGMLAGVNGALAQIVMASRVAYGLAVNGQAPRVFANVHPKTRTPIEATFAATSLVLVLAAWLPLVALAKVTSTVLLVIYALVNLALWKIKRRDPAPRGEGPCYPVALPAIGFFACASFLLLYVYSMQLGV